MADISFNSKVQFYLDEIAESILGETYNTAYRGDRGKIAYDHSQITNGNPHGVTSAMVGLGSVNNTADIDKPVSTATQTQLTRLEELSIALSVAL